ncbi:other/CAMKK/ELM protein kinase [Lentinula aciculospora]|uniref:Other/CAMKK/ELM protein kinase n=1 Tax=Lentinula aciculospora TaxID=153920 RepID=A0A9W9AI76_9AGAR|nr:other/CAMKK/ELM protein kinase [Lentinula aciculospora]
MEGGRSNKSIHSDTFHGVRTTPTIKVLTSERINQYAYLRRISKTSPHSPHVDVSIYRDTTGNDQEVLIKAVRRKMSGHEDKYRQLRRNFQTGNNFLSGELSIRKEVAVLRSCRHPHIVQLVEVVDDPNHDRVFLVLEYLAGGEIQWRNGSEDSPILTVEQSRRIFRDATLGLQYLHHLGIIHRDIKPANLVWSSDQSTVKIIDYGISHRDEENFQRPVSISRYREKNVLKPNPALFTNEELTKQRGTGYFMAPEVAWTPPDTTLSSPSIDTLSSTLHADAFQIPVKRPAITKAIDVWSLGVTLYCLLFGKFPFQIPSDGNDNHYHTKYMLFREICTQDWTVPDTMGSDSLPTGGRAVKNRDEVIALLDSMLRKDPNSRIAIDCVKCHPWVLSDIPNPRDWLFLTSPCPPNQNNWARQVGQKVLTLLPSMYSSFWGSCK